jgi:hypothetical protein
MQGASAAGKNAMNTGSTPAYATENGINITVHQSIGSVSSQVDVKRISNELGYAIKRNLRER